MRSGRPAKPAGTARNRNKPTHDTVVLPLVGREGKPPAPLVRLTGPSLKLWTRLWATPEATQWGEADVPGLTRLAVLASDPASWADTKVLGELRQLEDRYGCSPYSRRLSKWVRSDGEDGATRPAATVRHLKAVDPAAG